jgi:diguanylate cyclase (GGDEF)-like protein
MGTKLFNCTEFKALLREGEKLSLVLLDVDNFSNINDSYGSEYGDFLFDEIKNILDSLILADYDVYKLESDEYALVNTKDISAKEQVEVAKLVISYFNEYDIELEEDIHIRISFSIGISSGRGIPVLNNARLAIKELREHTRGTYKIYDMKSPYVRRIQDNVYWVNKIQSCIAEGNIVAFFQPIMDNKTKQITKYECLARMLDDGEYFSPYNFMDAAKATRMLSFITKAVIKQSCEMFRDKEYEFSINITNDDLQLNYLEDYLLRQVNLYKINPNRITLELLEDISTLQKGDIIEQLNTLRMHGFKVSIDDFGTESSNLSRLLEFQPDYLKIDGIFIKDIMDDKKSEVITKSIVAIAHEMGIKVIAEFIHSNEVQEKITSLGIDYSQGFYIGEPKLSAI